MAIGLKDDMEDTSTSEKKVKQNLDTDEDVDSPSKTNRNSIMLYAIVAVILIVIIAMIRSIFTSKDNKVDMVDNGTLVTEEVSGGTTSVSNQQAQMSSEVDIENNETPSTAINVGLPEFNTKENGSTTSIVYSSSDYIKDLNGADIPAVYNVAQRTYERDFVNYEKKRAIIDMGMEMYWLEILYKDKAYRCQVPYYIFKDLETTGICVVEIEVLTLDGGEQVISFMQVVSDYSNLINDK